MRLLSRLMRLVRVHWMPAASALVALVSMILVPPDAGYLGYLDWKTLGCLFCVLAVASALRNAGVFDWAARAIINRFGHPQTLAMTLVLTTAAFSMAFTNDVALVIMLPLSVAVLVRLDRPQLMPAVFALQALAANLCGMITPFGNPQNLYVFSYYHVSLEAFLATMALPFAVSLAGIVLSTVLMTRRFAAPMATGTAQDGDGSTGELFDAVDSSTYLDRRRLAAYAPLFVIALLAVFRVVPVGAAVIVVALALVILDRGALLRVDFSLLFTFVCFFVFAGNMARIPVLEEVVRPVMDNWGLLVSALASQVISNVPASILLSHFTQDWAPLLVGVNVGGAGTFVGSLASLIAIRHFMIARTMIPRFAKPDAPSTSSFLRLFGCMNAAFFVALLAICQVAQMALA